MRDFHEICRDVVTLIEGFPGYGTVTNFSQIRLKDQPQWVAFYNAVAKLSGTANDGTRSLNARVLSESPSTLSESAGAIWNALKDICGATKDKSQIKSLVMVTEADIHKAFARAAPVQAEPVAWQWRSEPNGFWNQMYGTIPDFKRMHKRELKSGEIEIRALYASPPTPQIAADHLCATVQAHGLPSQSDRIREAVEQYVEAANRYATPLSAGLDDMGKQNGSEEIPTRKQSS